MSKIGLFIEQVGFAVLETVKGEVAYPSTPEDFIIGAGAIEINQQPTYTNSEEIIDSLDIIDRFQDQVGAGTFTAPVYLRPSGVPGDLPAGPALFESLMGTRTVAAGSSVTFGQATTKPSFTLWVKKSHTVFFGVGACCDNGAFGVTNKGGAMMTFSGGLMRMGWAGTDELTTDVTDATDIVVKDASKFTPEALVAIGSDDNSGSGYVIASVDLTTNTITLAEAVTGVIGDVVKGYLPELLQTVVGTPLENRDTVVEVDGSPFTVKSVDLTFSSPAIYQVDEITTEGYPVEYVEDTREISGTVDMLFRADDLALFQKGYDNTQAQMTITIGDQPGSIFAINFPKSQLDVPQITSNKPTIGLSIGLTALGTDGEDSATMRFS